MLLLTGRRLVYELTTMVRNNNAINWITSWKIVISMHDMCVCMPYTQHSTIQAHKLVLLWNFFDVFTFFFVSLSDCQFYTRRNVKSNCNNNPIQMGRFRLSKTHGTYLHAYAYTSKQVSRKNTVWADKQNLLNVERFSLYLSLYACVFHRFLL